ncbi:MAG: hypothetical protein FJ147_27280 [Deltaproteobacteria bacterium]|nr:hypothetical protein [Deltaproteobacteria bacterium]
MRSLIGRLCGEIPQLGLKFQQRAVNFNAALIVGYGILSLGAIGYLLPSQVTLQVLPYYGSTIFGSACVLATPLLLTAGGIRARTNLIVICIAAYGSLIALAMEYVQYRSNSVPSTRVMLEDIMQLGSFAAGGCAAAAAPHRLIRTIRAWGVLALVSAISQVALMRIGALPSAWGDAYFSLFGPRYGSPSVYFALSMALCTSPAIFMSSRGALLGVAIVAAEILTGVASQTRTLLVNGAALLLLQARFDWLKRRPQLPRSLWCALAFVVIVSGVLAVTFVLRQRDIGVLELSGRDWEIGDMVQEMSGAECALGVGLGRGFRRYGLTKDGVDGEAVKTSVHLATGALLVKFGIPIGAALTSLLVLIPVLRLCHREGGGHRMFPAYLIACALLESAFAGFYKPVVLFIVGAAIAWPSESDGRGSLRSGANASRALSRSPRPGEP